MTKTKIAIVTATISALSCLSAIAGVVGTNYYKHKAAEDSACKEKAAARDKYLAAHHDDLIALGNFAGNFMIETSGPELIRRRDQDNDPNDFQNGVQLHV